MVKKKGPPPPPQEWCWCMTPIRSTKARTVKMTNYNVISLLVAIFSLGSVSLCSGQPLDESDLVIFESEFHHVSFYYPKRLLIPQEPPAQENMMYRFQSSLGDGAWLTIRFIPPDQASSLTMTCKDEIKVKLLTLDCETIALAENSYTYIEYSSSFLKEGQLSAIAWTEHPNGGIIDIQFSPIDENQKQSFRDIIKSIRLLE